MATTPSAGFLSKLSKIKGEHLTGIEAAEVLGIPQAELLGLSRLSACPKPRAVGVVTRYSVADLRKWALAGFPVDPKGGAYGAQRSQKIATRANANGVTQPAERERLIATFQRDGITTTEQAEAKADAVVLRRVRARK